MIQRGTGGTSLSLAASDLGCCLAGASSGPGDCKLEDTKCYYNLLYRTTMYYSIL